jgi:hypothetical protein
MKAKEDGSGSAAPRKRVRRGIEGWRTLISQQRASGETVEAFCAARGIPRSSFSKWRNRLESAPPSAAQFLPVALRSAAAATVGPAEPQPGSAQMRLSRAAANKLLDAIIARLAESL